MPKHLHAAHPQATPRRRYSLRVIGVALCLSAGLSACNSSSEVPSTATSAAEKLQTYTDCYQQLDAAARRSITRYQSWVTNMDHGPSGQEAVVHGVYKVSVDDIAQCRDDFQLANRTQPSLPTLDTAAIRYGDALKELGALATEADTYYSRGNYKDDAFSKGKIMHVLLADAMKTFTTRSAIFADAIDLESSKVRDTRLAATDLAQRQGKGAAVKTSSGLVATSHTPSP